MHTEISAMSLEPCSASKLFANFVAVAFRRSCEIRIFHTHRLERASEAMLLPSAVVSLLFCDFGERGVTGSSYIIAGFHDGSIGIITFRASIPSVTERLGPLKVISIGDRPIRLLRYPINNQKTILAVGRKSSLLFWRNNDVKQSPVLIKASLSRPKCGG